MKAIIQMKAETITMNMNNLSIANNREKSIKKQNQWLINSRKKYMIYLYATWYIFAEIKDKGYKVEIKEEVHCQR